MADLAGSAARGAAVTLLGQLARFAIQMVTLVVLARLLSPADFGLVAMVVAITGVGELIRDAGLSNASIQAKDLTSQQRSNLFWLSTLLGLAIGGVVAAVSPLLAVFYDQAAIQGIAIAISVTFLLNGLSAQHKASLARGLRFKALAVNETASAGFASLAAIILAAVGASFWALVVQQILQAALGLILAVAVARWMPLRPRRTTGMRPLIMYGVHLLGGQVVAYFSRNIDTVVLGQRFGASVVGYYSRAFQLVMTPLNQINVPSSRVAIPVLSRLQDQQIRYNAFLLRGQKALMLGTIPALGLVVATATPLVEVVLGPEWAPSVVFLQLLAISAAFRSAGYPTYWVALSRGFTRISLYVNLASAPLYGVFIVGGSFFGPVGVAWGFLIASVGTFAISLIWYSRAAGAPGGALLANSLLTMVSVVPAAVAAFCLTVVSAPLGSVLSLVIGAGAFAAVFALTVVAVPRYRTDVREVLEIIRLVRRRDR